MSFDYSQLEKFDKQLLDIAKNQYPKLCKTQVRQATNKGVKVLKTTFKSLRSKEKSKNKKKYVTTFKASKRAWQVGSDWNCRLYNSNSLGHIIEGEHVHTGHKQKKVRTNKTVKGFHTYEKAEKKVEEEFYKHIRDKMVPKIQQAIKK